MNLYILGGESGHEPVRVASFQTWMAGMMDLLSTGKNVVAKDCISTIEISTIFLWFDHGFMPYHEQPVLFETMVFGMEVDRRRCATWEQAEQQHREVYALVQAKLQGK